ncbi:MAG: hypothetical protein FWF54_09175 [Candidatus Azobacteroides sp.]|nr:hypothetical protein [Candidatus Azobacteroides sp.]
MFIYTLIWLVIIYFVYMRFRAAFWLIVQIYIATFLLFFIFGAFLPLLLFSKSSGSSGIIWLIIIFIVSLLLLLCYFYKKFKKIIPTLIASDYSSRTEEQQQVIRYFLYNGSILSKEEMKDEEYDALLKSYLDKTDFKQRALNKFDLDESEFTEVNPVKLENYYFEEKDSFSKKGKDGKVRSSAYQISWVFGTNDKFYIYRNTIHLDQDVRKETANEYYWKDIDRFFISNETKKIWLYDIPALIISQFSNKTSQIIGSSINYDVTLFSMSVHDEKIECFIDETNDSQERTIRGLKTKLDEKKKG